MHTPGPWKYVGRLGFGHLVDPNIAVAYGGEGSGHQDDGEANAKLIAAAPELRDELERVTGHLETWMRDHPEECTTDILAAIACAHVALDRALGK